MDNLTFEIEKHRAKNLLTGEPVKHFHIYRNDTKALLGVVGERYRPVPVAEFKALANETAERIGTAVERFDVVSGGSGIFADIPLADMTLFDNDEHKLFVRLENGYDGKRPFSASVYDYRLVCSNGLRRPVRIHGTRNAARHTQSLGTNIGRILNEAVDGAERIVNLYIRAQQVKLTAEDTAALLDKILGKAMQKAADSQREQRAAENKKMQEREVVLELLRHNDGGKVPGIEGTAYALLNAVTHYVDHVMHPRVGQSRTDFADYGYGQTIKTRAVTAIESLLEARGKQILEEILIMDSKERRNYLGGSDIAAALGLSQWRTPMDVWLEKTGRKDSTVSGPHIERGVELESVALRKYLEGYPFIERYETQVEVVHDEHKFIRGHIDALTDEAVVEIKCPTLASFHKMNLRGIPTEYQIQGQIYAALSGRNKIDFAFFCADRWELAIKTIDYDPDYCGKIIDAAIDWWQRYVETDTPPPIEQTPDETLARDESGGEVIDMAADERFAQWEADVAEIERAYAEIAAIREELINEGLELVASAPGKYQGSRVRFSIWQTKPRETFDYKRFIAENPEINVSAYLKFSRPGIGKRLTLLKP